MLRQGDLRGGARSFPCAARDPECPVRLDVLLDLLECESEPSAEHLRTVSSAIRSIQSRVQFDACAIVAETDVLFGIARMFEVFTEEQFRVTEVFRSVLNAEAWLTSQQSPDAAGESPTVRCRLKVRAP